MARKTWSRVLCGAFALALPLTSAWAQTPAADMTRTVTVVGSGQVAAAPDIARITIGVVTEAEGASEALRENNAEVRRLIAVLDTVGVEGRDRQTANISIQPRYRYEDRNGQNERILTGYTASNSLSLTLRDLAGMGDVLDSLVAAGGNQLNGIRFDVSETEALLDDARREAIADARRKATLYAEASGVVLGDIITISEVGVSLPNPPVMMEARAMAFEDSVPIEAGETELSVRITTVWELAPLDAPE